MAKTDLMKKIMKCSDNPYIDTLMDTELLNREELVSTSIYGLNVALSGEVTGGFSSGVVTIAGKSKHFKTLFALMMAKAYLKKHEDAVLVFYDSEFGSPREYFFNTLGKDFSERVIHAPVLSVEDFRTQIMNHLEGLDRNDKVIFICDSIGNLASMKETDDSISGKQTVDMTRAKILKSTFRLVTPRLTLKDFTLININHTYETIEMFSKEVMGGGTGGIYASDTIFFIGKQQEKDGKNLLGYNFIINIEKSRYVKEKEKIGILVTYDTGINKYSGIFELATEFEIIGNPTKGYYTYPNTDDSKKVRRKEIENDPVTMQEIVDNPEFQRGIENKYKLKLEELEDEPEMVE